MAAHGHSRKGAWSPTYYSWAAMVSRCTNPKRNNWHLYGGRGIAVCDRWREFAAFLADMGERPPGTSLDRIDPSKGYSKGNCRWATRTEQNRNRRNNRLDEEAVEALRFFRATGLLSITEAAERFGVSTTTVKLVQKGATWERT